MEPSMTSPFLRLGALASAACLALLAACGGGDPPAPLAARPNMVTVQTYLTDNLTLAYSKVWVSIRRITALDGAGAEVVLLDAGASPVAVNLASLAAVGQFVSTVTVPAGIYRQVTVTMDNAVQLVSKDGTATTNAKFAATGTEFVLRVRDVELDARSGTQFVFDFDLEKFTYDPATGLVTPSVRMPRPAEAFQKFVRQFAEAKGTVKSVDAAAQTLTVDDPRLGPATVVKLATGGVVAGPSGAPLTLADVKTGDRIEAKGVVTPGATTAAPVTVTTLVVEVKTASGSTPPMVASTVKGEGKVVSVQGSLVTVAIEEANFLPGANTVVVDVGGAKFSHGQASDLAAGVKIEFSGTVSGTGASARVVATRVQIEGAASAKEREKSPLATFAALEGKVGTVGSDGRFVVQVRSLRGPGAVAGTASLTVDPKNAIYVRGNASCLASGREVDVLGTLEAGVLQARLISVEGCTGQKSSGG
jgi:hypothetical protein